MTIVDGILITGTLGICAGVWVTLAVILSQHRDAMRRYDAPRLHKPGQVRINYGVIAEGVSRINVQRWTDGDPPMGQNAVARYLGISRGYMSALARGTRTPGVEVQRQIMHLLPEYSFADLFIVA